MNNVFIGAVKNVYTVYFYHKRNDSIEDETVEASNEQEAKKIAMKKHRQTYPKVALTIYKIEK